MSTDRADSAETKRRLLDAAGLLFAGKGYRDTKTADICELAGANSAAVNYHFGSKEELFAISYRHEFERSIAKYPPDGGVPAKAPATERLRGNIQALVKRVMDPTSRELDIAYREMANPTGLLAEVIHRSIEPLRRFHLAIVRELLGPAVTEQDVELCSMSIHGQCFVVLMHERHRRMLPQAARDKVPPKVNVSPAVLSDHIVQFSLAGLTEIRRAAERRGRPTAEGKSA